MTQEVDRISPIFGECFNFFRSSQCVIGGAGLRFEPFNNTLVVSGTVVLFGDLGLEKLEGGVPFNQLIINRSAYI